ncbi:MAG TPA: hypothetical protein EYN89_02520 [Flavobacteriales bacterium]|nr:hypothetical protein [Flavobacteriales bacterium]
MLLTLSGLFLYFDLNFTFIFSILCITAVLAIITSIYTAFLFRQAKGRDLWQSPLLLFHMLIHSFMAGGSVFIILSFFIEFSDSFLAYNKMILTGSVLINLFVMFVEFKLIKHTPSSKKALMMISSGRYKISFWIGVLILGNIIPLCLIFSGLPILASLAGLLMIIGIYVTEHIWVEAPQRIPLT